MPTTTFVGRGREAAFLRDAVADAAAGRGRLVLLAGEPGIGKTRLAEEIATSAAGNGVQPLWGRCWEGGGAPAFWPWIQLIRTGFGSGAAALAATELSAELSYIAQLVPELRSTWPAPVAPGHAPGTVPLAEGSRRSGAERFRLFDAVTTAFRRLAARTPLMLVLDDLHAADEDSLVLLHFLARELKQMAILVVGTYRELEVRQSATHAPLIAAIGREGKAILLRGLSLEEVADLVGRTAPVDRDTVTSLWRATGGNPFFLDEIVRLMAAERTGGPANGRQSTFSIPDSIRTAIHRRMTPLAEQTRRLLTVAAVIGNEFDLPLLEDASGLSRDEVAAALREAVAHAIVLEPSGPRQRYRFSHAIIADALRTALAVTERAEAHRHIATALERVHAGDVDSHLASLSHHYIEALPLAGPDRAVEYARRGAARAREQLAFAEAARLCSLTLRALDAMPAPDERERCRTLLALGEAQAQGGSLEHARHAFEQAAQVARRLGDATLLAETALRASAWFGTFFTLDRALIALVEEALDALASRDSALGAQLLATLAGERYWAGDRDAGLALSDQAVAIARRVDDPRALVSALWISCQIRWGPENVEGRLAAATEIAGLAESTGEYQRALRAREMRFTALLESGDVAAAEAEARAYAALARRAGEEFGIVERFDAALALLRGDFAHAERRAQELAAHARRRQDPALLTCAQVLMTALWEEQGRLDPAEIAQQMHEIPESPALVIPHRVMIAFMNAFSGRQDEARAEIERLVRDGGAAIPRDWNWLDSVRGLAVLCLVLRDVPHAAALYELILPYADRNVTAGWGDVARGSAALYVGALAALLGRLDEALAHLERAVAFNRRMGARPSVARAQFEMARVLLKRDPAGARERAGQLLRAVLATTTELGMKPLEQRAHGLLAKAGLDDADQGAPAERGTIGALAAAAMTNPGALRAHAAPDGMVTILFSDVEGSSELFDRLGDRSAHEILDAHNAIIREQVAEQRGYEVNAQGDGFMIVFSSARRAIVCATGIQRALAAYSERHTPIRVRIGIHVGEPLNVASDLTATAVIVAARIAAHARGGEILVSSTLRELTEGDRDFEFADAGEVELKGLSGMRRLYRVLW